jgi:hypothetical protein
MIYLLDANTLITANNTYYAIDTVPEYWEWLQHQAEQGRAKMPFEIFEEVKDGPNGTRDLLFGWIQATPVKNALILKENVDAELVAKVVTIGYAPDLTDIETEALGRDPFLVAYALTDPKNRVVVTAEVSKPSKTRHNRKLPDVRDKMGAQWCDPFEFNKALKFSTKWRKRD